MILGLTYEYLAWPTIIRMTAGENAPPFSALTSDYQGLFSSKRFEGLLINRWYNTNNSIRRNTALDAETQQLIGLLEARKLALQ